MRRMRRSRELYNEGETNLQVLAELEGENSTANYSGKNPIKLERRCAKPGISRSLTGLCDSGNVSLDTDGRVGKSCGSSRCWDGRHLHCLWKVQIEGGVINDLVAMP